MNTSPERNDSKRSSFAEYLNSEPVLLALLFALAVISFSAVTALSRLYQSQQQSLANRWFTRGATDLSARHFDAATLEFRTALRYSRDNYSYQLNLAQALLGSNHISEAQAYLVNLFDRQPENGFVNLELARIAAQGNDSEHALRYYHNAIYATWPAADEVAQRREVRLELIEYLLRINETTHAQAELIALQANMGDDPEQQRQLGDLFVRARDYEHALAAYRSSLRTDRHNAKAEAGAGEAAYHLSQYQVAARYLQSAVAGDPSDATSASLLKTTDLVLQLDPYETGITAERRNQAVKHALEIAGNRLQTCGMRIGAAEPISSNGTAPRTLGDDWEQMKPRVTERGLEHDPDLADSVMNLVFEIEQQNASSCVTPTAADEALLLIAKSREGR